MSVVLLALGASLGWGTSDFLGGVKSRALPVLSVLFISQTVALALLAVTVAGRGEGPGAAGDLAYAAAAGLGETVGIAALYRGLAVGTMGIVAPVAATAPVVPLVADLASGELPGPVQLAGLALVLAGVAVTSHRPAGAAEEAGARVLPSVAYGLLASLGFGTFFLAMGRASEGDIGWALLTARSTAVAALAAAALARRRRLGVGRADLAPVALIGCLIVAADTLYATATTHGLVSVAAVLGSLHAVVTLVLARVFLHERLERTQQVGVGACLLGVMAVAAG
ncbi:DMT family transporter [Streptomyces sp. NPDC051940]|uniref:DMT family transporter n=1 Tax=Streptomyces sp. NPDC051940 TaxID=3155675 RepID=UPI003443140B